MQFRWDAVSALVALFGALVVLYQLRSVAHQIKLQTDQLVLQGKQLKLQHFTDYTKRYHSIVLNFPEDINDRKFNLTKRRKDYTQTMKYMGEYFELALKYHESGTVPLLRDAKGMPLKRNFVHVDDLVEAITLAMDRHDIGGRLFNICMDRPVVYGEVAEYLKSRHGLASIDIPSGYHSNWMDNSAAKFALGWRPNYDLAKLIDAAWSYRRSPDDPRKVWYPG